MSISDYLIIAGLAAGLWMCGWWIGFHYGDKAALEKVRRALGASRVQYTPRECMPGHVVIGSGILVEFQYNYACGCILPVNIPSPNSLEQLIQARDESRKLLVPPNVKVTWA